MSALTTANDWWHRNSGNLLTWLIVGATFVMQYLAYIRGFRVFYPDSRYYLAMAFLFGGDSAETARQRTVEFASPLAVEVPGLDLLFGWGLVQPRVVLPALATPFVKVFGPYGLGLTTLLITVALTIVTTMILMRRYGNTPAVATMILVNGSLFLMSFHTGMLTESLSGLWTVLALLAAWKWIETRRWRWVAIAAGVTVASAFTRQATLIVAGAFVMAWALGSIIGRRNSPWMYPAIAVAVASVGSQVLQSLVWPSFSQLDQFLMKTGTDSFGDALLAVPGMIAGILISDFRDLLQRDQSLLVLIGLAIAGMILFWRRTEAHLLLGAILATGLYNVTNGTPTQFRYATPGLIFFILMAAYVIYRTKESVQTATARTVTSSPATASEHRRGEETDRSVAPERVPQ